MVIRVQYDAGRIETYKTISSKSGNIARSAETRGSMGASRCWGCGWAGTWGSGEAEFGDATTGGGVDEMGAATAGGGEELWGGFDASAMRTCISGVVVYVLPSRYPGDITLAAMPNNHKRLLNTTNANTALVLCHLLAMTCMTFWPHNAAFEWVTPPFFD